MQNNSFQTKLYIIILFFSIIGFYIYGITWSVWSDYGSIQALFQIVLALMLIVGNLIEKYEKKS